MHRKSMEVAHHLGEADGAIAEQSHKQQLQEAADDVRKSLFFKNAAAAAAAASGGGDDSFEENGLDQEEFRSHSIASLRAKAHEHAARLQMEGRAKEENDVFVD